MLKKPLMRVMQRAHIRKKLDVQFMDSRMSTALDSFLLTVKNTKNILLKYRASGVLSWGWKDSDFYILKKKNVSQTGNHSQTILFYAKMAHDTKSLGSGIDLICYTQ